MIKRIAVVGTGQMGAGIALVAAQSGFDTLAYEPSEKTRARAQAYFEKKLSVTPASEPGSSFTGSRIKPGMTAFCSDLSELEDCDLIIEAIPEQESLKAELFEKLDQIAKPEAILASNTSSISISKLASFTKRPEQVMGMHFMNPVPIMKLVELIRGQQTSDKTYEAVKATAEKMGKVTTTSKDHPGFIANRILMPMINEAFDALQEGLASAEDIDTTLRLGANHPMGPLTLADFIGLDTCVSILKIMGRKPSALLQQYVDAGKLGKKSGQGVFKYV
ncbi:MAG: 3-hydroxybutyryl-CoA dehydrogenase [Deltaproteobacteria bacterium]|nr:3-hydroxybutyryl-CoA dehydrogenase [Deltaproteobacteria bacterium]